MKPDKIKLIKVVIVFIVTVISGVQCWQHWDYYSSWENPFQKKIEFKRLYYATSDSKDNIYRIDMSQKRITKTSGGKVEFEINLNRSSKKEWKFSHLAVGDNNTIFASRVIGNSQNEYTEIVQYTGNSEKVIYPPEAQKNKSENDYYKKIAYMYFKEGSLFIIEVDDTIKPKKLCFKNILSRSNTLRTPREFIIPQNCDLNKVTGIYPDSVYFTSKKGEVYKWSSHSSMFNRIYAPKAQDNEHPNPVFLSMYDSNRLAYVDVGERKICMMVNDQNRELLTEEELNKKLNEEQNDQEKNKQEQEYVPLIAESISVTDSGDIVSVISDNVVSMKLDQKGELKNINKKDPSQKTVYKTTTMVKRILLWIFPITLSAIFIYLLFLSYKSFLRKKIILKQIVLIIFVGLLTFVLVKIILNGQYEAVLTDKTHRQLDSKVNIGVSLLNMDDFESIKSASDFNGDAYKHLNEYINTIQKDNVVTKTSNNSESKGLSKILQDVSLSVLNFFKPEFSEEKYYSIIYKIDKAKKVDNEQFIDIFNMCVTDDNHKSPFHPYFIPDAKDYTKYCNAVNRNTTEFFEKQTDATGEYMVIIKPIMSQNSYKVEGLYEIGLDRSDINKYINTILNRTLAFIILALILCLVGIGFLTSRILAPLKQLKEGVEIMDGKNWREPLAIHTGDELQELSKSFNKMNNILKDYINEIEETQKAYARFVPRQITKLLEKEITEIRLTDQNPNKLSMYLMVSNIRSFYSLSGKMLDRYGENAAEKNLEFINNYFNQIGPVIPKYGGFINEYLGYGVMALFPDSHQADNCLQAALMMQKKIKEYNKELDEKGEDTFEISVAVHLCGKLILGIVGFESTDEDKDRLEAAVIDEGVILTEAMEKSASKLGATILATDDIIRNLESSSKYQYRYLGLVSFEDIEKPVEIYDVFHEDNEIIRKAKENTKIKFETAVSSYQNKDFKTARDIFIDIIGENEKDEAAKTYFFLCDEYIKKEPRYWSKAINP